MHVQMQQNKLLTLAYHTDCCKLRFLDAYVKSLESVPFMLSRYIPATGSASSAVLSFLPSLDIFCGLLITSANSLYPDQAQ